MLTADKMESLILLLTLFTLPAYSHLMRTKSTAVETAVLDRDDLSVLRDDFVSVEERGSVAEYTERKDDEHGREGVNPETNPVGMPVKKEETMKDRQENGLKEEENSGRNQEYGKGSEVQTTAETLIILEEETIRGEYKVEDLNSEAEREKKEDGLNLVPHSKRERHDSMFDTKNWKMVKTVDNHNPQTRKYTKYDETEGQFQKIDQMEALRQEMVQEERESKLVAGISLHGEITGNTWEGGNKQREENTQRIFINSQDPLTKHHHNVTPTFPIAPMQGPPTNSLPPTANGRDTPQLSLPALTIPDSTVSTAAPGEGRSASLLEDLVIEVLQSPGYHLKQNKLEVKASINLEDEMEKNKWSKSTQEELQTTHEEQESKTPKVQAATPQPKERKFMTKVLNTEEPNPIAKSNENISTAKLVELTRQLNMAQSAGKPKLGQTQNKPSAPKPQLTKPSAKPQVGTAKTPSTRPTKINRSRKNKTIKSGEKKRKKYNKTQKPEEKKKKKKEDEEGDATPTHFPYFMDNYCPPECVCYGRVVQCSDKGVDRVPYGIPYNARYILLMNNHINMIQLDLLDEYVSMEFLVLSNNRLTDGAIEGAFGGVPALKRLYLDRNLLESVPTDLPVSLEELRLDNNQLSVMSEAAWARCPSLLVLSLSNNSLGNGSESLPNSVLSPLCNLRTLNLDHNQLMSVPQGLPLSIKELYLKGNLIEHFRGGAFDGVSELLVLDLSANRLTNKGLLRESLLNTTHLESLNLEGNRLRQVPRHLPCSLKTLNLEGNLLSSIKKSAFSTLKSLEHLGLARNKIFKVAIGAFRTLPILHQLDLCNNTLHQVPRQLPQGLHTVALTHNKIQSVPRDAFCWGEKSLTPSRLVQVQLENNLIDMGKLDAQAFRCLRGFQVVHFY